MPQFYLRGFTGKKDELLVTDRRQDKTFRTAPDNVASQKHFNRIAVEGMDPNAIEKALADFESEVAPALERIRVAKSLAKEEDKALLVNLMAAVALRNPWRRSEIGKIVDFAARRLLAEKFATKEKWQQAVAEMKADGVWDEKAGVTFEDMQHAIKSVRFDAPKELSIAIEVDQHDPLAELLWKRRWQLLKAADDSGGFVTTDDPVCLRWSDGQAHGGLSPGFGIEGTEVIFPLSTTLALRGTFDGPEGVIDADAAMVAQLNSLIISNAQNQVYAHDHFFKFMCESAELGSGATLLQDEKFLRAGEEPKEGEVVPLRGK